MKWSFRPFYQKNGKKENRKHCWCQILNSMTTHKNSKIKCVYNFFIFSTLFTMTSLNIKTNEGIEKKNSFYWIVIFFSENEFNRKYSIRYGKGSIEIIIVIIIMFIVIILMFILYNFVFFFSLSSSELKMLNSNSVWITIDFFFLNSWIENVQNSLLLAINFTHWCYVIQYRCVNRVKEERKTATRKKKFKTQIRKFHLLFNILLYQNEIFIYIR